MRDQTPHLLSFNSQIRHHEDGCHVSQGQNTFEKWQVLYPYVLKFFKNMSSSQPQLFMLRIYQDFNFAWPFWYGWDETGLNGQNGQANLKSCGYPRIKLKNKMFCGRET